MAPYEALYGRSCRCPVCWTEVGKRSITSPDLIRDTFEKVDLIQRRLLMAQSREKIYADRRRRPLEFEEGDHIFLKMMPEKGVIRFGKRGKLSSRYIEPFEILERVGTVVYRLALLMSLKVIHFQSIFVIDFYLKRLIYVQKYGITNQTVMQQGIQEKEEFLQ